MDGESRDRQFWMRVLLIGGFLCGTLPLITIPLVLRDTNINAFEMLALIFNGLSVLPASALAFWHRRIASVWLTIDAGVVTAALVNSFRGGGRFDAEETAWLIGSIAVAVCLDFMEFRRWPEALQK